MRLSAHAVGLVSQLVAEGEALRAARATAAQLGKFDRRTAIAAKKFIKPIPHHELRQEIDLFCELFAEPAVEAGLRKFVESTELATLLALNRAAGSVHQERARLCQPNNRRWRKS